MTLLGTPLILYFIGIIRRNIKSSGTYALEGGMYWASRSLKRSLAGSLSLKQYCRLRLADENQYLFVPSSLDIKLHIDKVFVKLSLINQGQIDSHYSHSDILNIGNRLRVIGDPGSGKSSLVKRLFRDACYTALSKPSQAKLPVIIELKTIVVGNQKTDKLGEWFLKRIREGVRKSSVYKMDECFDSYTHNSGVLVLLDGLDEVSTTNYQKVQHAILGLSKTLSEKGPNNSLVLTMRTQFHQQVKDDYRNIFGTALFLKPFSPSDIYEFLVRWPFQKSRSKHIARIYGELTDRPTLREMCSNPLILSMYVAEDQAAGHVVAPESRTEFYRKVAKVNCSDVAADPTRSVRRRPAVAWLWRGKQFRFVQSVERQSCVKSSCRRAKPGSSQAHSPSTSRPPFRPEYCLRRVERLTPPGKGSWRQGTGGMFLSRRVPPRPSLLCWRKHYLGMAGDCTPT